VRARHLSAIPPCAGRKCQNKRAALTIPCNPLCNNIHIAEARPEDFLVVKREFFPSRPAFWRVFFCPTPLRVERSVIASPHWVSSINLRRADRRLCFAPTQIRAQRVLQPLGLDTLFVLCIFRQYHSPIRTAARRGRCQMHCIDASGLTLGPSLRIGPHLRYCCCSSVVERVIGNDEVGSSILPSSTMA
jgi:hypothetical protein